MAPGVADLPRLAAEGWPRHDPLRWRFIETLAGRAAASDDPLRTRLEARVAALLTQYGEAMLAAGGDAGAPTETSSPSGRPRADRPLAALLAHIAVQASPTPELRTLQRFRRTWSRLAADQRVLRSRLNLPRNAGPLNSQHLVHRALTLMHELSPEYLERFVAHADTLLWLDQASGGDLPVRKDAPKDAAAAQAAPPSRGRTRGRR